MDNPFLFLDRESPTMAAHPASSTMPVFRRLE
jgi:hypothetical protein